MTLLAAQSENFGKNQAVDKDTLVKDDPLREDIRLLGRMLGDTLREQEGEPTFELIENIRQTAIRFRREQGALPGLDQRQPARRFQRAA